MISKDIIVAPVTPPGRSAIAVFRVSGNGCIDWFAPFFKGKNLRNAEGNTIHYGFMMNGNSVIDEVMVSVFRAPKSYTKEESLEVSLHGSPLILEQAMRIMIENGARTANPGEFTLRAFANGRFDLAQAEAVADLIDADSEQAKNLALNQLRGGVSKDIDTLREELIRFAALIELELDFSEEDVEFADRSALVKLILEINHRIEELRKSFVGGNALKNGVPVAIVGVPNVGKSTLLNALLNEDRAIVSPIPGTTRDVIEEVFHLNGISFRFIDTAGFRETEDLVESIGIQRTLERVENASLILLLNDGTDELGFSELEQKVLQQNKPVLYVSTKSALGSEGKGIQISAKEGIGLDELKQAIFDLAVGEIPQGTVISNIRHLESLIGAANSLDRVMDGLTNGMTGDFLSADIRQALHFLGLITGNITTDDLLDHIFSKFCIGK